MVVAPSVGVHRGGGIADCTGLPDGGGVLQYSDHHVVPGASGDHSILRHGTSCNYATSFVDLV